MRPVIKCAAIAFVISCLIVPWQYTADFNGNDGFHSRKPAGYSLLIDPPVNTERTNHGSERGFGVKIDFDRLLLEWLAMSGVTGLILFLRASRKGH